MPITLEDVAKFLNRGDLWSWGAILAAAFVIAVGLRTLVHLGSSQLRLLAAKTAFKWDDIIVDMIGSTRGWVIFVWALNALEGLLTVSPRVDRWSDVAAIVATSAQISIWGLGIIRGWHQTYFEKRVQRDASSAAALGLLYNGVRAAFLVIVALSALNSIGVDVHAFVAGLGVGGIAIAFAAQAVLGDLLASFSIVLDKPFVVGDFIVVGNLNGVVENIGIRTTRVRALSGEQLVFANKDLVGSRVQNFKDMWQRRVVQKFSVPYHTPTAQLRQIPGWIRGFVDAEPRLKFDRCHLAYYGASTLDFELVFYVTVADYNVYMDLQQELFLQILEKFAAEGIDITLPGQTVYVKSLVPNAEITLVDAKDDGPRP